MWSCSDTFVAYRNAIFLPHSAFHGPGRNDILSRALQTPHITPTALSAWLAKKPPGLDVKAILSISCAARIPVAQWLEWYDHKSADGCPNSATLRLLAAKLLDDRCHECGEIKDFYNTRCHTTWCSSCYNKHLIQEAGEKQCDRCGVTTTTAPGLKLVPWPGHEKKEQCTACWRLGPAWKCEGCGKTAIMCPYSKTIVTGEGMKVVCSACRTKKMMKK
ncbi:hypothetical protein HBH70_061630 [Parastagonospora nodorum]|nr:hypothetical protein HBH52_145870 [Parastagonospora nodorum]KAH4087160.1 hypothetical protein HBH46_203290 [Parastagonospora nodorum]KAH4176677.1 hypothetical protein HBH43_062080 [Parastagonospora nodorum]KAH4230415.1 hypothetical protein HBI06_082350 [Parastagonospora nodorum]KAH4245209.1 hypothetical protein HBI05_065490 [Parastagonospora nodorum]